MEPEILKKLEEINKGVVDAQAVASRTDAGLSENQSQIKSISENVSEIMLKMQEIDQKQVASEKYAQYMEKIVTRMQDSGDGNFSENDIKAKNEFLRYLRKGDALSEEVVKGICDDLAKKSFLGQTDSDFAHYTKALVEGTDPAGGYFTRPQILAAMISRIFESSPIRSIATTVTTTSDSVEMIIDDNEVTDGGWVGEVSSRGDTDTANIGKLVIACHEIFAQPKATQKMIDDAGFDIEAWLLNKVTNKIGRTENTAFVSGNGSNKPKGFLTYPSWTTPSSATVEGVYERGKLDIILSGVNGDFDGDALKNLQNSLIEDYQADAKWLVKRKVFEKIITLKDGVGRYLLTPESLALRDGLTLLGKPVIFANDMPVVATDSLSVAYGDFGLGYTIVDRLGFRVLRDQLTAKPYIKYYVTKRTGGDVTNYQSIKLLKLSA